MILEVLFEAEPELLGKRAPRDVLLTEPRSTAVIALAPACDALASELLGLADQPVHNDSSWAATPTEAERRLSAMMHADLGRGDAWALAASQLLAASLTSLLVLGLALGALLERVRRVARGGAAPPLTPGLVPFASSPAGSGAEEAVLFGWYNSVGWYLGCSLGAVLGNSSCCRA